MAIIDGSHGGDEISQLWAVITELSDQLNQNRSASVSLYAQAGGVKNQALHSQTGFVLRKFNADKPKEIYDSELERMNAAMMAENQSLQHDNKQLNTLIKEYEQTLDTLMSTFRNRAQTVQENELSLIRHYESHLLQLEEENSSRELEASTRISESISRLSELLRNCLREVGGERTRLSTYDDHENDSETEEDPDLLEREPWQSTDATHAEWALEREIELARLERENEELRNLIMAGRAIPVHAPQAAHPAPTQIKPQTEEPLQPSQGTDPGPQLATKVEEVKDSSTRDRPTPQPHGEEDLDTVPEGDLLNVDPYATVKRSKMGG
ncbi:uncharacterized protein C8R40DRAFT_1050515 [Lentinula edodes]|uniref:uncharacterized protein n=1 Tax=Lentinula edodes TaxID=5353 RepID=UPI001E8D95A1|nr:uncharacterized protein C8R40DRAFT_1050515 [Lentinula edodes]KAH7873163.1 hypothetical protein C8R40DRAFT_1050515 [Lentinula edodes]